MDKTNIQAFESVRRGIARRLKIQLPLAGMLVAAALLCGCGRPKPHHHPEKSSGSSETTTESTSGGEHRHRRQRGLHQSAH